MTEEKQVNKPDDQQGENPPNPPINKEDENKEPLQRVYSQAELDAMIGAKLAEAKINSDKQRAQAEELAKLDGAERAAKELEMKVKDFEAEKQALLFEKTELEVTKQLSKKGLPIEFAGMLISKDAEESFKNIGIFEKKWSEALEKALMEKLKGPSPKEGTHTEKIESTVGGRLADNRKKSQTILKENPYF